MQGMPQMAPAPAMNQNQILMQQQQLQNLVNVQGMVGMMNSGAMQQNRMQHPGQALIFHDHSIGVPDPKRMRMETPLVSAVPQLAQMIPNGTQAVSNPALMMMSVQELAVAAMQQQQGRGRKKSQAQIDRRRERNRILARRTRLRKKFFFESLQKEVMDLQRENMRLKGIVKEEITTEEGQRLLDECDAAEKMPPAVLEACGEGENGLDMQDLNLVHSIQKAQHSFIITDPSLADNPIVFASDGFLQLTGYSREQVLGRNCRFLQGTDTNVETVKEIKQAMAEGDDVSVTMLNYMADGTPFWNRLFIAALRDAQNNIVNFIGVVVKVPGRKGDDEDDDEDEHDDDYDDQQ